MGAGADPVLPASGSTRGPDGLTDEERKKNAGPLPPDEYDQEEKDRNAASRKEGNNSPMVTNAQKAADAKKEPKDPTLTDMLLRDVASGKVRRARAGARRMTFGGSFNPYDTPLGG